MHAADAQRQPPGAPSIFAFALLVLALGCLVMVHLERSYELDPQMRARAGLVDAQSDISLMRAANFGRALTLIGDHLEPGGTLRGLSVTPSEVGASLLSATGE